MGGSVDENSTESDDEYEDLAVRDCIENGYWSEYEYGGYSTSLTKSHDQDKLLGTSGDISTDKYQHNLDRFLKMSAHAACSERSADPRMKRRSLSDSLRFQGHEQSAPGLGESASLYRVSALPVAP